MAVTGDTLTMPDGTSFCIIESAADSGRKRIEFEITMAPGAQGHRSIFAHGRTRAGT